MIEHVQDDIKDSQDFHEGLIDSRTDEIGNIQQVTLKEKDENGGDRKMYLTKGKVVMTDDGTMVNSQASDKALTVVDGKGKAMMISPKDIFSVDAPVKADEEKKSVMDGIMQEKSKYYSDIIDGVADTEVKPIEDNANTENAADTEQTEAAPAMPKMGDTVELTDENGNKTATITIQKVNADGYEVSDGNRVWVMNADEMQKAIAPKVENAQGKVAEGETATNGAEGKTAIGEVSLSKEQAGDLLGRMEANAEKSNEKELTAETWSETFDENNSIETQLGALKWGITK